VRGVGGDEVLAGLERGGKRRLEERQGSSASLYETVAGRSERLSLGPGRSRRAGTGTRVVRI